MQRPASEAVHIFEPSPQIQENVRFKNGSPLSDPKVSSAIKLAIDIGKPSASDASRAKARTSSLRLPSSTR